MPIPNPTRLFHITAIANLPAICEAGTLLSKSSGAQNGIAYQNIAHQGAQDARSIKQISNPPGGRVHDYVPFYFAPRSPNFSLSMADVWPVAIGGKQIFFIWKLLLRPFQ